MVRQWGGEPRELGPVEGVGGEGFREAPCRGEGRAGEGGNRGGNKRDLYGACFPSFLFLFFFFCSGSDSDSFNGGCGRSVETDSQAMYTVQ